MNALYINTGNRNLSVSVVDVTQTQSGAFVLRFGGEVGDLIEITKEEKFKPEMPVIIPLKGYKAQESAGFVNVCPSIRTYSASVFTTEIHGIQGMSWQKYKGLVKLKRPINAIVLPSTTVFTQLVTHASSWGHSNPNTAEAAIKAVELMARFKPLSVFIEEGQSDYTLAWEVSPGKGEAYEKIENEFSPLFEEEKCSDPIGGIEALLPKFDGEERKVKDDVLYHRHSQKNYWHPVTRVHKEEKE
ncbi:MAG: hypothetical protein KAI57_00365 [Candidatus Pacebacteria bacterium]|nr:hypothetical protein [Candidatus Paceibacterota bacterium]